MSIPSSETKWVSYDSRNVQCHLPAGLWRASLLADHCKSLHEWILNKTPSGARALPLVDHCYFWCCRGCQAQLMLYVFYLPDISWQRAHTLCTTNPTTILNGLEECTLGICFLVCQVLNKALFCAFLCLDIWWYWWFWLAIAMRSNLKLSWLSFPVIMN